MNRQTQDLLDKAYRMEGLIKCARLAEDNDNFPALKVGGDGVAEVLAVMADLMADISAAIELLGQRADRQPGVNQ